MPRTSQEAANLLGEALLGQSGVIAGAAIDSRRVQEGNVFFALPGEKADGHDFIPQAWASGAALVVASKQKIQDYPEILRSIPAGKGLILVDSVLEAMHILARAWRRSLGAKVVAVTGSNGKTTTKDMIAAVLGQRFQVYKTEGNFNNEIGMPLTILNAPPTTEVLVLEMGMRGLGQIEFLCRTALPDIGVITNIGQTHLELLGSQENIAAAKWELVEALGEQGTAILNAEDYWSVVKSKSILDTSKEKIGPGARPRKLSVIYYGIEGKYHKPDLQGRDLCPAGLTGTAFKAGWGNEEALVELPLPGEHNVLDALAALAVGVCLGVPLQTGAGGLKDMQLSKMRLEIKPGLYGSTLISDVYNANPASMIASLQVLKQRGTDKTLAVLGEMYELGEAEISGHRQVGEEVARLGIARLIAVGALGREIAHGALAQGMAQEAVAVCDTREQAVAKAKEVLAGFGPGGWVLIKGSRGMKMEQVTDGLLE